MADRVHVVNCLLTSQYFTVGKGEIESVSAGRGVRPSSHLYPAVSSEHMRIN